MGRRPTGQPRMDSHLPEILQRHDIHRDLAIPQMSPRMLQSTSGRTALYRQPNTVLQIECTSRCRLTWGHGVAMCSTTQTCMSDWVIQRSVPDLKCDAKGIKKLRISEDA